MNPNPVIASPVGGPVPRKPTPQRPARRTFGICAVVAAVVFGAGGAYAYTSAGGMGSGSGSTGTMLPVTIAAFTGGDIPGSTLLPGGTADVILRMNNPNPSSVRVYGVTGNGAITADASHPACMTTGVTFTAPATPISPTIVIAGNSSALVSLAGAAAMNLTSSSACQGAEFRIPVTMTARQ